MDCKAVEMGGLMETSGFFIEQVDWQTAQASGLHESGSHFVFLGFANFPGQPLRNG